MAGIDRKVMIRSLEQKGFKPSPGGNHVRYFYYRYDKATKTEKITGINVSISMGKKYETYGDDLLRYVKMQLWLDSLRNAKDFLTCDIDRDEYDRLVAPRLSA